MSSDVLLKMPNVSRRKLFRYSLPCRLRKEVEELQNMESPIFALLRPSSSLSCLLPFFLVTPSQLHVAAETAVGRTRTLIYIFETTFLPPRDSGDSALRQLFG